MPFANFPHQCPPSLLSGIRDPYHLLSIDDAVAAVSSDASGIRWATASPDRFVGWFFLFGPGPPNSKDSAHVKGRKYLKLDQLDQDEAKTDHRRSDGSHEVLQQPPPLA